MYRLIVVFIMGNIMKNIKDYPIVRGTKCCLVLQTHVRETFISARNYGRLCVDSSLKWEIVSRELNGRKVKWIVVYVPTYM